MFDNLTQHCQACSHYKRCLRSPQELVRDEGLAARQTASRRGVHAGNNYGGVPRLTYRGARTVRGWVGEGGGGGIQVHDQQFTWCASAIVNGAGELLFLNLPSTEYICTERHYFG